MEHNSGALLVVRVSAPHEVVGRGIKSGKGSGPVIGADDMTGADG